MKWQHWVAIVCVKCGAERNFPANELKRGPLPRCLRCGYPQRPETTP